MGRLLESTQVGELLVCTRGENSRGWPGRETAGSGMRGHGENGTLSGTPRTLEGEDTEKSLDWAHEVP